MVKQVFSLISISHLRIQVDTGRSRTPDIPATPPPSSLKPPTAPAASSPYSTTSPAPADPDTPSKRKLPSDSTPPRDAKRIPPDDDVLLGVNGTRATTRARSEPAPVRAVAVTASTATASTPPPTVPTGGAGRSNKVVIGNLDPAVTKQELMAMGGEGIKVCED